MQWREFAAMLVNRQVVKTTARYFAPCIKVENFKCLEGNLYHFKAKMTMVCTKCQAVCLCLELGQPVMNVCQSWLVLWFIFIHPVDQIHWYRTCHFLLYNYQNIIMIITLNLIRNITYFMHLLNSSQYTRIIFCWLIASLNKQVLHFLFKNRCCYLPVLCFRQFFL
jgi:hypothetical protein